MRHGDKVQLLRKSDIDGGFPRKPPVGAVGKIIALRDHKGCLQALVKYPGFGWPRQAKVTDLKKV